MRVCFAKSSTLSIGESILSIVKNAAKLAVYDEIIIRVKNHQKLATVRDDIALKICIDNTN